MQKIIALNVIEAQTNRMAVECSERLQPLANEGNEIGVFCQMFDFKGDRKSIKVLEQKN